MSAVSLYACGCPREAFLLPSSRTLPAERPILKQLFRSQDPPLIECNDYRKNIAPLLPRFKDFCYAGAVLCFFFSYCQVLSFMVLDSLVVSQQANADIDASMGPQPEPWKHTVGECLPGARPARYLSINYPTSARDLPSDGEGPPNRP